MKKIFILISLSMMLISISSDALANDGDRGNSRHERRYRLEANVSYEYLSPNDVYGSWKTVSSGFYGKPMKGFTYFFQLSGFSRKDGEALLGTLGAYKDWSDSLYTYSAISVGTESDYLPEIRLDHDFNLKFGAMRAIVWTLGASYIRYFDIHRDTIISTGMTLYRNEWIWNYKIFRNESDPGDVISYSHLISIGYGREGWQWTNLDLSFGKQAYLATYMVNPEEVRRDSLHTSVKHRHWIGDGHGVFGDISYFDLKDGYDKYGISIGVFKEF
ncbi:MAG: hypothetical protein Fur0020_07390 [Thermodesulfovibrionia bacterium]